MTSLFHPRGTFLIATVLLLPAAWAANISATDYQAGRTTLAASYKTERQACNALQDNAKDVCVEEAKAREKVGRAELESSRTGTAKDANRVLVARAEAAYSVAKEQCDAVVGNTKDVCRKEAKAVEVKALASAKLGKDIGSATRDAAADVAEADYKVAVEKCDALAGDPKSACVKAAKSQYGRN